MTIQKYRQMAGWLTLLLIVGLLSGCATAEVVVDEEESGGGFDHAAAAETAEAATTSTARVDYLDELLAAETQWQTAGITDYHLELNYNEGRGGFQYFDVTVEDGQVTKFKHTCTPERTCLRVKVDSEDQYTIDGVFSSLKKLADDKIPLAILRFDEELGFPQSVSTNSDEARIYRMYRVEKFERLEN